jgi:biopolymer transport protein ExbB
MFDLFILGGPVMLFIGLASVIACAVFLNKIFHLHRAHIDTQKFVGGIRNVIKKKNYVEAVTICAETPGPISAVFKAGLVKHERGEAEVKKGMEMSALVEVPRLEKDISILLSISYVAPLLGFLGTALGLMKVFMKVQEMGGVINVADIAGGVWESLICTAAGLVVAIPSFLGYNYLLNRVQTFVIDMERSATELADMLTSKEDEYEVSPES